MSLMGMCLVNKQKLKDSMVKLTCQVHTGPSTQMASHKLAQVVAGCLIPEPVTQPPRLMCHEDGLVLGTHALIRNPGKIPAVPRASMSLQAYGLARRCRQHSVQSMQSMLGRCRLSLSAAWAEMDIITT